MGAILEGLFEGFELEEEDGEFAVGFEDGVELLSLDLGVAKLAQRLSELTNLCGEYGVFASLCAGELWQPLQVALSVMQLACAGLAP